RPREDRLRRARHVLEEDVSARDERRDDERDLTGLPDDHALDVGQQPGRGLSGLAARLCLGASRFDHAGETYRVAPRPSAASPAREVVSAVARRYGPFRRDVSDDVPVPKTKQSQRFVHKLVLTPEERGI